VHYHDEFNEKHDACLVKASKKPNLVMRMVSMNSLRQDIVVIYL
ncbi:8365_t:CDS:1, partial [Racocetra persica]